LFVAVLYFLAGPYTTHNPNWEPQAVAVKNHIAADSSSLT
jgi:hypothetical protein